MPLNELRKKIDQIDSQLVELINERAKIVVEVGKFKQQTGSVPIYAPDREKAVLDKICGMNQGPLPDKTFNAIWRELMSGSFFLERPLRIAFLGPEGSFSHAASVRKFGQSVEYEAVTDIQSVFDEVAKGHSDLGVVPVENSYGGGVVETLDAFIDSEVLICAEMYMSIHHNLLANCPINKIEKIYSKPEIFSQCRNWLSSTFKETITIPTASSAKAAIMAAEEENAAAIGSAIAAERYGLKLACEKIEDTTSNITRFLVISKSDTPQTGDDKTVALFSTADRSGALVDVLSVFKEHGINMTSIGSRPNKRRKWEYYFFADLIGHRHDDNLAQAFEKVKHHCLQLSVLGSFPKNMTVV